MWYCCEFALILQDSSEIEEESTFWHDPYDILYRSHQPLLDSRHDWWLDLSDTQAHDLCQTLYGSCRNVPETGRFGNRDLQVESQVGRYKRQFACSRRQARQGRARERLERAKGRLGERKRSEKAKVGLRISFNIAFIMISPLYLYLCCIRNMFE